MSTILLGPNVVAIFVGRTAQWFRMAVAPSAQLLTSSATHTKEQIEDASKLTEAEMKRQAEAEKEKEKQKGRRQQALQDAMLLRAIQKLRETRK